MGNFNTFLGYEAISPVGNLMIKPEYRLDSASEEGTFMDNDLMPSKSLSSFVLAAVYAF